MCISARLAGRLFGLWLQKTRVLKRPRYSFNQQEGDVRQSARVSKTWLLTNDQHGTRLLIQCSKDAATNPRGIPYAPFVDKVEDYVSSRAEVDGTMKSFQEMISYVTAMLRAQPKLIRPRRPGNSNSWKSIRRDEKQAWMRGYPISRKHWRRCED